MILARNKIFFGRTVVALLPTDEHIVLCEIFLGVSLTSTTALDLSRPLSSMLSGVSFCMVNVSVRYAPMSGRPKLSDTVSAGLVLMELTRLILRTWFMVVARC